MKRIKYIGAILGLFLGLILVFLALTKEGITLFRGNFCTSTYGNDPTIFCSIAYKGLGILNIIVAFIFALALGIMIYKLYLHVK